MERKNRTKKVNPQSDKNLKKKHQRIGEIIKKHLLGDKNSSKKQQKTVLKIGVIDFKGASSFCFLIRGWLHGFSLCHNP